MHFLICDSLPLSVPCTVRTAAWPHLPFLYALSLPHTDAIHHNRHGGIHVISLGSHNPSISPLDWFPSLLSISSSPSPTRFSQTFQQVVVEHVLSDELGGRAFRSAAGVSSKKSPPRALPALLKPNRTRSLVIIHSFAVKNGPDACVFTHSEWFLSVLDGCLPACATKIAVEFTLDDVAQGHGSHNAVRGLVLNLLAKSLERQKSCFSPSELILCLGPPGFDYMGGSLAERKRHE